MQLSRLVGFALKPTESATEGLRRLLGAEIDAAMTALGAPDLTDARVHAARKHIKKARAIVRLVERRLDVRRARRDLRHAARLLSRLRDAAAISTDAEALCRSPKGANIAEGCAELYRLVRQKKTDALSSAKRHRVGGRATLALKHVRRDLKKWRWSSMGEKDLVTAIRRSYKRARRWMTKSRTHNDASTFHAWRKRVKTLWYALRLLEPSLPDLRPLVTGLHELETLLGHEHNLHVLGVDARRHLSRTNAQRVATAAATRQRQLRSQALRRAAALLKDAPRHFDTRLRRKR